MKWPSISINSVGVIGGSGRIGSALAEAIQSEGHNVESIGRDPKDSVIDHDFYILAAGPESYENFDKYCDSLMWMKNIPNQAPLGIVAYLNDAQLENLKETVISYNRSAVRFLCTFAVKADVLSLVYYIGSPQDKAVKYLHQALPESRWKDILAQDYGYHAALLSSAGVICELANKIEDGLGCGEPGVNPGNEALAILEEAIVMIRTTMSPSEAVRKTATPDGLTEEIIKGLDAKVIAEAIRQVTDNKP